MVDFNGNINFVNQNQYLLYMYCIAKLEKTTLILIKLMNIVNFVYNMRDNPNILALHCSGPVSDSKKQYERGSLIVSKSDVRG